MNLTNTLARLAASGTFHEVESDGLLFHVNSCLGGHNVRLANNFRPSASWEVLIAGHHVLMSATGLASYYDEASCRRFIKETNGWGVLWATQKPLAS
jgi:hypothetical protein